MNRITQLLNIKYPIIQGGMIWCSGWRLASAVSNAGGLGLIGAGSMTPDLLREHITKCKNATSKPFGVNIPLLYPYAAEFMQIIADEKVPVVVTSAGSPAKWTPWLKERGITVIHVVSNAKFAVKCQQAGVDAVVAEGFEAGGHNGREETTTMVLIPLVRKVIDLPLIAAGGIATGSQIVAAMTLGAEGVQMGSLFAASDESSAHIAFKQQIVQSGEGDTHLTLKPLVPTRLIKNQFFYQVEEALAKGTTTDELQLLLGQGRAKKGMFDGNVQEGELEIGQVAAFIDKIKPVEEIFSDLLEQINNAKQYLENVLKESF